MIEVFGEELKLLRDPKIKRLVWACMENAPKYFWVKPSSNTGKYHPEDEFSEGGRVLHTKRAVKIAYHLCECLSVKGIEKECVIAATLMHDLTSDGYPDDVGHTVDGHGYLWTELARSIMPKNSFLESDVYRTISRLILFHMGKYDMPYILDWEDELATIVHISDYLASRRGIIVNIMEEEENEVTERQEKKEIKKANAE